MTTGGVEPRDRGGPEALGRAGKRRDQDHPDFRWVTASLPWRVAGPSPWTASSSDRGHPACHRGHCYPAIERGMLAGVLLVRLNGASGGAQTVGKDLAQSIGHHAAEAFP